MFCPNINGECVGERCREWDKKKGECRFTIVGRLQIKSLSAGKKEMAAMREIFEQTERRILEVQIKAHEESAEIQRYNILAMKLTLGQMLRDPTLPPEVKEGIQQAFQAPSSEAAEKLLRDAGLI